jgi:hypothetical protein
MRVWLLTALALSLVAAAACGAALLAWPAGTIGSSSDGLAEISLPGFAGHVEHVDVTDSSGKPVPVQLRRDTIWPSRKLAPGTTLTVTASLRRPSWIGWLVGGSVERTATVVTPVAHLETRMLRPRSGAQVAVRFDVPVSRVAVGSGSSRRQSSGPGRTVVRLGVVATGAASSGATTVAAAVRPWETLPKPDRVSWFVAGPRPQLVAQPAAGGSLTPRGLLTLTFSKPVADVLGSSRPRLVPATRGRWSLLDANTLAFQPAGFGFPLGGTVEARLPAPVVADGRMTRLLSWHVATGSTLRLQELLARLGYLPVRWRGATARPATPAAELAAAVSPPQGVFSWRFAKTPAPLVRLWKPGRWNVVTEGAVMSFEDEHGLATDGVAGPQVWHALLRADLAGRRHSGGYSYVLVHETIPQSLNLWHNGKVILTSPGNTGIAQAPTQQGTWPVFEHISSGTMSGTNPDGSHYNDPGVRWISYFHGGDAIHAFPRASYGTPQSLGCVELPYDAAASVWPYTPLGTLVTIES